MAYRDETSNICDICGTPFQVPAETYEESGLELHFQKEAVTIDVCRLCADQEDRRWTTDEGGNPARYTGHMEWQSISFDEVKPFLLLEQSQ